MRIEIQLRIIADDDSVISEGEILHFDKGDDRLEVIGLSFDEAKAALAGEPLSVTGGRVIGVVLTGPATPRLERVVIGSSQFVPLAMTLDADPVLVDNVLSFRDNRYDAIGLLGGGPAADAVLRPRSFGRDDGSTISNLTCAR